MSNARPHVLTSLRHAAQSPMSREELDALRSRAWHEQKLIVINPDEINDDFVRQGLVNEITRKFGRRMKGR